MIPLFFKIKDPQPGRIENITIDNSGVIKLWYPCESSSSCTSYESIFPKGIYKLEVWGSQGGSYASGEGGLGGYAGGILNINKSAKLFFNIGGISVTNQASGSSNSQTSYNGGGRSGYADVSKAGAPGGGATDVRVIEDDFDHRIIVGGGGGGGGSWVSNKMKGGYGGGDIGSSGTKLYEHYTGSEGGNSLEGGSGGSASGFNVMAGSFGEGSSSLMRGAGGGGGWYGGSAGLEGGSGGGGGSGYINSENSQKPQHYALKESFYLIDGSLIGNVSNGLGHVSITIIHIFSSSCFHVCDCMYHTVISFFFIQYLNS